MKPRNPLFPQSPSTPRKVLLCVATAWAVGTLIAGWAAGAVRVVTAVAQLPLFGMVPLVAFVALLSAGLITEVVRTVSTRTWSEKKHWTVVGILWLAILVLQVTFLLRVRARGA